MATLSKEEVLKRLRALITYETTASELARRAGCTHSYMSRVLAGTQPPSQKICDLIGVKRGVQTIYILEEEK